MKIEIYFGPKLERSVALTQVGKNAYTINTSAILTATDLTFLHELTKMFIDYMEMYGEELENETQMPILPKDRI